MARFFGRRNLTCAGRIVFLAMFIVTVFRPLSQAQLVNKGKGLDGDEADRTIFQEGEYWFELLNFKAALNQYRKLIEKYPEEEILNYRIGVCELYFSDKWASSLTHLQKLPYDKYAKTDYTFFLGCALHLNLQFEEAIAQFNKFLASKKGTKQQKDEAKFYITNCQNGIELKARPVDVTIKNIGAPINTEGSEYVPLISGDESAMVFTYRGERSIGGKQFVAGKKNASEGEYFEDIMHVRRDSAGNWKEPVLLNTNINTTGNDACVSLSHDGHHLLMFRSLPGDLGTLYETRLDGHDWVDPELLGGDVNSPSWEGSITISPDGKTAYFASERPGGKGGRDIYHATLLPDGTWGHITNAGDSINTKYDDDAPFYHPSGQYLIICSRGHNSMGGYDIFRCDKINDSTWTKPKNLGFPINTPGEDIYYSLTADGKKGFYSSGKTGGMGLQDIYIVEPGLPGVTIKLLQVNGTVTLNDKPINAEIEIYYSTQASGTHYATKYSNSATGKYLAALPEGNDFTLKFKLPGLEPQIRTISSQDITNFLETTIDVSFYTEEFAARLKKQKDSSDALAAASKHSEAKLVEEYASHKAEGLVFRVQIGAYNLPQNFNYSAIMKMEKVEKLKLEDNVTRFVMGRFENYADAKVFRDKVIAAGITDAFITAIYKDRRVYIKDLVEQGIFKK